MSPMSPMGPMGQMSPMQLIVFVINTVLVESDESNGTDESKRSGGAHRYFAEEAKGDRGGVLATPCGSPTSHPSPPLSVLSPKFSSPRELRWLLAKKPEKLDEEEQ